MSDFETEILGNLILCPSAMEPVSARLSPGDFLDGRLGRMFATLQAMSDAGKPIGDALAVRAELRAVGLLSDLGGDPFLERLAFAPVTLDSAIYAADQIRAAALRRRLVALGNRLVSGAQNPQQDAAELARRTEAELNALSATDGTERIHTLGDAVREILDDWRNPTAKGAAIPTGIPSLDANIGGLYRGELVVVAARANMGKSSLCSQIGIHVAEKSGGVLYISLEMTSRDIAMRQLASAIGCEVRQVRSGFVTAEQIARGEQFLVEVQSVPFRIEYGRSMTVQKVRGLAKLASGHPEGLKMICIDYLGLLRGDPRKKRWEAVGEITAGLKELAQEMEVPVLVACQINRDGEGRLPTLAQLSESGSIEQDADVVALIHRQSRDATEATLSIAKHRNGPTFDLDLNFDPATTTFSDRYDFD